MSVNGQWIIETSRMGGSTEWVVDPRPRSFGVTEDNAAAKRYRTPQEADRVAWRLGARYSGRLFRARWSA